MQEPTPRKDDWGKAWRALRGLIADPERTELVFEIVDALAGKSFERNFHRFRGTPEGQRLLRERPSLLETLSDRETLKRMPPGSLGRAYAEFMEEEHLDAHGLEKAAEAADRERREEDPDREFFGNRLRDMHDLWHVLTGYGRDEAGEAANLAFTVAQVPSKGIGLIVLAAAMLGPMWPTFYWQRYLFAAWRRGRRTSWLPLARYEELLPRPLAEVRQLLEVPPAIESHPDGILVSQRDGELATAGAG